MRAIIFSDSHRSFGPMMDAIERFGPFDMIIHAGDVQADVEDLKIMYPKVPIVSVKGNNDPFVYGEAEDRFFTFYGVKTFLTHGHKYGVKYSETRLLSHARDLGAQLCIFGHTHKRMNEKYGEVTLFNPGSAARSFGILEADDTGFNVCHYDI